MSVVHYCGGFDVATYGSVSIDWTDASGSHSISLTTGQYVIGDWASPGLTGAYADFVAAVVFAMDAATAQTVSGSFDFTTGFVTLACTGGTFSFSFVGASGGRMRALLGFNGSSFSGQTSYTGTFHPVHTMRPYLPCVSGRDGPSKEPGRSVVKRTSDGTAYVLKPATIIRLDAWRHDFEPKTAVDRDWYDTASSATANRYTWEDLWDDHGDLRHPIWVVFVGDLGDEYLAFDLMEPDYTKVTHKRMGPRDDVRFAVMFAVSIRERVLIAN